MGEPASRSRARDLAGKLLLLAVSTLLAVVLAEGLLRAFVRVGSFRYVADDGRGWNVDDAERGYVLTPGYRGRLEAPEFVHRVEVNSLGFRGPEPSATGERSPGPIFVLGDSFVFGVGAERDETLPARLGVHLEGTPLAGRQVWNLGIPSHSSPQYVLTLEAYRRRVEPSWAVACFFLGRLPGDANDLWGAVSFEAERGRPAEVAPPSPARGPAHPTRRPFLRPTAVKKWLARHSALYTFVLSRLGPALRARRHAARRLDDAERARFEEGWALLRRDVRAMARAAEDGGFGLLLVHLPEHSDVRNGHRAVADRFLALAADEGLPAVDVHALLAPSGGDDWYYPVDGHLDPAGYDRVADAVARALVELENDAEAAPRTGPEAGS